MVEFLNAKSSLKILKDSSYFKSKFEYYESLKRQKNLKNHGITDLNLVILDFTDAEIQCLKWYLDKIVVFIQKYARKLMTFNFQIGKLRTGFDWDFPFTVNRCIFLTEKKINNFRTAISTGNQLYIKNCMTTIVHELVHIHQRINVNLYEDMYRRIFGFKKAKVYLYPEVSQYKLTNPDGLDLNWILPYNLNGSSSITWFLPMATVNQKCEFVDCLIPIREKVYSSDYETVIPGVFLPITAFPLYTSKFGITKQLYHPNEISAQLIAEYVIQANIYPLSYSVIKYLS